jgi:trans-2,3-dihydro-3-hydroxyanthranilate isomerase
MRRKFVTLDVFTDRRFAGNPLAVVLEAGGLDQAAMQAIAREFNLPETVFVFPAADRNHRARIRIFTPANELPFAGHPTVGTAVLLACLDGGSGERELVLEEAVGLLTCRVVPQDRDRGRASFATPKLSAETGKTPDLQSIAAGLQISPADNGFAKFRPGRGSAGLDFVFVPLRGLEPIGRCRADTGRFDAVFGDNGPGRVYMFCAETAERGNHFHARMFAPGMGIPEDPASGSAVAALSGLIAASGGLADGEHNLRVEQGYEMGRPSLLELGVTIRGGKLSAATIGGGAVMVGEGSIEA